MLSYSKKLRFFSTKQRIMLSIFLVCTLIILYEVYLLYSRVTSGSSSYDLTASEPAAQEGKLAILQSKQNMEQGELLDVSKVEMLEVPREMAPKGAITSLSAITNMRLKQKVAEREFLNELDLMPEAAAFEDGDRLTEHDFEAGAVPAAVVPGSIIDIKLFVRGSEDPLVVSKTAVISRNENLLSFYMNSREQELIKEAAAEGMLFVVQYLEDSQNAGRVTYAAPYEREDSKDER